MAAMSLGCCAKSDRFISSGMASYRTIWRQNTRIGLVKGSKTRPAHSGTDGKPYDCARIAVDDDRLDHCFM